MAAMIEQTVSTSVAWMRPTTTLACNRLPLKLLMPAAKNLSPFPVESHFPSYHLSICPHEFQDPSLMHSRYQGQGRKFKSPLADQPCTAIRDLRLFSFVR